MEDPEFDDQDLIDNMKMFYFAGTETTGSLIATIVGYLAVHPEEREMLKDELYQAGIYEIDDLTHDKPHGLERLNAVMYEALRLVPPIPIQVRNVEDFKSKERGSYFVDHYHRLRNRDLAGESPDQFDPERFIRNPDLIPQAEKTFGRGRTPCIGKLFAKTETLLLVASMTLESKFEWIEGKGGPAEVIREASAHISPELKIRVHLKFN